jgi:DNA-binding CsgD family transcriptional regulator
MATPAGELLERDDLLARIHDALEGASDGRGRLVVLEGPAGIGKTAVIAAARARAEAMGVRVLGARGGELEREFAFGVVRRLFAPALSATSAAERAALLDGPAGRAAALLDLPRADAAALRGDEAPGPAFGVLHGLYWLCAGLAAPRPLLLTVDDAHWADASSLRYLAFLAPRLEELPVALLVASRPREAVADDDLVGALAVDPAAEVLRVPVLSDRAVARMVETGLAAPADPAFVAACRRATGGSPLLLRELIAALAADGVAPTAQAAARVEGVEAPTIGRWAVVQLARLAPEATALAKAVAVLETAGLAHAAAVAGLDPDAAADAADALAGSGLLDAGRPLAFAHPIVRAGVYAELTGAERAAGHRRAAELLAPDAAERERVAEHLLATEPAADPWVAERLADAARAATAHGAPDSSVAYLRRAVREPPPPDARAGVLLALGVAALAAGDPRADDDLAAAVAAAPAGYDRVRAALVRAHALALAQRSVDAVDVIDRALGAPAAADAALAATAEAAAVAIAAIDAATAPAMAHRIRALPARAAADPAPSRDLLGVAAIVAAQTGEPAEVAAGFARRALAAGPRPVPDPGDLPWYTTATIALVWTERWDEAIAALDAGATEARASGDGALFAASLAYRAWVGLHRGDLVAAEADARMVLDTPGLQGPPLWRDLAAGLLLEALVEQGRAGEAAAAADGLDAGAELTNQTAAVLRHGRGRARLAAGDEHGGLADLLAARRIMGATHATCPNCLPSSDAAALALRARGDRDGAGRLAGEDLERARSFGAPRAFGVALRTAGVVDADESRLREAVRVLERASAPVELARARTALGAQLRRGGHDDEARELLRAALDAATHAGARPVAAAAEAELRASGAKPRRVVLTGLEALTASERRVAELAAKGLTNREVAQELFVTARTVEGHLTRVFRKLGVGSRDQLTAALAAPAAAD